MSRTTPTEFPELNAVLKELTEHAQATLGENFVGAYLQGSFAVGDADINSDCDFLIPVNGPITTDQEASLRAFHDELPTRDGYWCKHLEGSYPDRSELKTLDGLGRPWLYIDHGWREMQWSTHCNTEVVRWSLRECGVTLTGPVPPSLVDEVPPDALRARMRATIPTFLDDLFSWTSFDLAWSQRYAVTTYCRTLLTLKTAQVASKKASLEWALATLDPRWRPLLEQVINDRALGFVVGASPRPGSVKETLAFGEYVRRSPKHRTRANGPATGAGTPRP